MLAVLAGQGYDGWLRHPARYYDDYKSKRQHTRMSGTPFYWLDVFGDKNKGPLIDKDIYIIAEATEKDPASAQEVFATSRY